MPVYEYACEKCGLEFEVEQRITENPLTEHEGCGGAVKRLISLTSFALKGSGWYSDHYGLKGSGSHSCGSSTCCSGSKPATNGGGDSKAESKTESKAEPKSDSKSDSGAPKPEPKKPDSSPSNSGKAA